jgi:hypothetical protein
MWFADGIRGAIARPVLLGEIFFLIFSNSAESALLQRFLEIWRKKTVHAHVLGF